VDAKKKREVCNNKKLKRRREDMMREERKREKDVELELNLSSGFAFGYRIFFVSILCFRPRRCSQQSI
jgi:hypothetical protein